MVEINSSKILGLLGFAIIYILLHQIKKVLVAELDKCIYDSIIEYFLAFEYSFTIVSMMLISNFSNIEILIGYTLALLIRLIYNKIFYSKFYRKLADKVKRDNVYNK